jgi:hypothetical protein
MIKPIAWRLWDEDPINDKPRWVYYDESDFKPGIDPTDFFEGLKPLYLLDKDLESAMIKPYSLNFPEKSEQEQMRIVWTILFSFTRSDVDNFINERKDGWNGDAGLLARRLSLAIQSQL